MAKSMVVLGAQWGDEGKGKITNYYSSRADIVVRYQGGDNAGHTIVFEGKTFKLHALPSGIFSSQIENVLGNGMVVNPKNLYQEILALRSMGYDCKNLKISDRAHVIFSYHLALDEVNEQALGERKIGTTKKGIGPCYTDKIARTGVRMVDFVGPHFKEIYARQLQDKNEEIVRKGGNPISFEETYPEYQKIADELRPVVIDTIAYLHAARKQGKKILFEGAQGAMLDIDYGSYPYVTSSNTTSGGVITGSGIGLHHVEEVFAIVKAYTTRVGNGGFPTEMFDEIGDGIRERAGEYGATTHRPRRIGWEDLVLTKYSVLVNGITGIGITLLDILSGLDVIKVCVAYEIEGKVVETIPASNELFEKAKPIYKEFKGWKEDISHVKSFEELPMEAKQYLNFIEQYLEVPVILFSVGADREQTIVRKEIF